MVLRLKARESRSLPGLPNALGILFKTPSFPDDVRSDLPLHVISLYMRTPLTRGGAAPFETPKAEQTVKNARRLTGKRLIAGWSSPVARQAHNLKVVGSNPAPAPKPFEPASLMRGFLRLGVIVSPVGCRPNSGLSLDIVHFNLFEDPTNV
jgi:hypothetical protein